MRSLNDVRRLVGASILSAAFAGLARAAPALHDLPLTSVTIDDPFWSPKYDTWRSVTLADCLDKFERDGVLKNFDYVAGGATSKKFGGTAEHHGAPWFDGLTYEMIRACADFMAQHPDPKLKARLDGWIDRIAAAGAKDPDGFLNTYTTLEEPDHRWGQNGGNDRFQHDLYNIGALVEAGVHYYRATGETKLLTTAVRAANYMSKVMGPSPKQNIIPGHAIGETSFTRLYELLKEQPELKSKIDVPVNADDYLALAKFWLDARGHHEGRESFGPYNQDGAPLLETDTIEGHAVRAALVGQGMIAVGLAENDPRYVDAAATWWRNMVGRRMYITGGIGSFADDEKFGPDFVLPNDAYAETCAAVANGFFSHELNLALGDASAADELERTLYNNVLSGVSLKGDSYYYMNPLEMDVGHHRWDWHGCPCCPPMFLKLMGALPGYIYATSTDSIYVNLFIGSRAAMHVADADVSIAQTTHYPWNGDVLIAIDTDKPATFDLKIRIPSWARGESFDGLYSYAIKSDSPFRLAVNGKQIDQVDVTNGYASIRREWRSGDTVSLQLEMPVQRVKADDRVEADRGRVAFMRGPVVYCVETPDGKPPLRELFVPKDAPIVTEPADKLGGATLLKIQAHRMQLDGEPATQTVFAIPFYANTNRGPVEMAVWLPDNPQTAQRPTLASIATPTASHCFERDTLAALNDGATPKSSADDSRHRFTWWDHRGTTEWVQYTFDKPRTISAVDVYWWDDTQANGHCRVPQSWSLQFKAADGSWKPVPGKPTFGTSPDTFNTARFDPIETTAVRIEVQLMPDVSAGILQWRVQSADEAKP